MPQPDPQPGRSAEAPDTPAPDGGGSGVRTPGPRFRAVLGDLPGYRPGKPPAPGQGPEGRAYKLSSNESPYGPLPSVRDAIAQAGAQANRYPDNTAAELISAIAERHTVPEDHIAVGCGSVGVTQQLLEAVGEPGAEVVYAWRSFEAYPVLVQLAGATPVPVPLREQTHDLARMADHISARTRLVFVCNPNNPTGTVVGRSALQRFLDRVPDDCLAVLDEAYREYVQDPEVPDGLDLRRDRPNVAVLRTFSKAYGLAGLRVGFLVGPPPVAEATRKTQLPFTVNRVAQAAAVASLGAEDELLRRVQVTVAERERIRGALLHEGYAVAPSEANFVWLPLGEATLDFARTCEHHGVTVRPFPGEGARVTIGDPEANDALLTAASAFTGPG